MPILQKIFKRIIDGILWLAAVEVVSLFVLLGAILVLAINISASIKIVVLLFIAVVYVTILAKLLK